LYKNVTINSKEQALLFLKGQHQAIEPRGGHFVYSLDIIEAYMMRSSADNNVVGLRLFAAACPNVQYLLGDGKSWQFWSSFRQLNPAACWSKIKSIPFSAHNYGDAYAMSMVYRNSLTDISLKTIGKDFPAKYTGNELFAYIKACYPKLESLEMFQRKIKHVFELDLLNQYFPNMRALVTGRGRQKYMVNPPRDAIVQVKMKGKVEPLLTMERLDLCLPKLEPDSIEFITAKFPAVKTFNVAFDKVANLLVRDKHALSLLLVYLLTRENYSLILPVDCPAFILNEFYRAFDKFFAPDCHRLTIKYGPDQHSTSRRPIEQYCPTTVLQQGQPGEPGHATLEYIYFTNDELFLNATTQVFEIVGARLKELDIDMSQGYFYTVGSELMNGYFLDTLIFNYCKHLQHLRLQHFHLVGCSPAVTSVNESIWQLYIISSHLYTGAILDHISLRLPKLRQLCLDSCMWTKQSTVTSIILSQSHLERLMIVDVFRRSTDFVKWVVVEVNNGTKAFYRPNMDTTDLTECPFDDFTRHSVQTDYMIYIRCKYVKQVDLHSQYFNLSCELNIA
jgi:hypothetical protein